MSTREVNDYKRRLDNLFELAKAIPTDDFELKSHMARYLCVLVSGFIEVAVRAIYNNYCKNKSSPYVRNFVDAKLKNLRNVHMGKLLELTRSFSPAWETSLSAATAGELEEAINSVVALRNQIAHGQNTSVSFDNIKKYYERVLKVIRLLEDQCA